MHLVSMVIADLIAIAALCTIYLVRHSRRELVVSYTIINFGVFVVTEGLGYSVCYPSSACVPHHWHNAKSPTTLSHWHWAS